MPWYHIETISCHSIVIVRACIEYLASDAISGACSSASINVTLELDRDTSFLGNITTFHANVTNYNKTVNASLTYFFCYVQRFYTIFPLVRYLGCTHVNASYTSLQYTWKTAGNVTVYVFTLNNTASSYGCDHRSTNLGSKYHISLYMYHYI